MVLTRRTLLGAAAGLTLSGCGFRPVYGPTDGPGDGDAATALAQTEVALIPERLGQILRESLRTRFDRGGSATARRYELAVSLGLAGEAIGVQRNSTSSRVRLVGTANWTLYTQTPNRTPLTNGFTRDVDGYNIYNQQYFAADLESEAVQRRMMEALAEKLTLQLAAWFRAHPQLG